MAFFLRSLDNSARTQIPAIWRMPTREHLSACKLTGFQVNLRLEYRRQTISHQPPHEFVFSQNSFGPGITLCAGVRHITQHMQQHVFIHGLGKRAQKVDTICKCQLLGGLQRTRIMAGQQDNGGIPVKFGNRPDKPKAIHFRHGKVCHDHVVVFRFQ